MTNVGTLLRLGLYEKVKKYWFYPNVMSVAGVRTGHPVKRGGKMGRSPVCGSTFISEVGIPTSLWKET